MLSLILAEAALETVPRALWSHPATRSYFRRRKKLPQHLLLDRSYHYAAMKRLEESEKRGRPDIVHFSLLEALGSPLNKEGLLQTFVHSIKNYVITVNPETRLSRNYDRFLGLREQLFKLGRTPSTEQVLLNLEPKTLSQLLHNIAATHGIGLSRRGAPQTFAKVVSRLSAEKMPVVIIGAFPHGHFTEATTNLADEVICIDAEMLEARTITSGIIYEYERTTSLPLKRLERMDTR